MFVLCVLYVLYVPLCVLGTVCVVRAVLVVRHVGRVCMFVLHVSYEL